MLAADALEAIPCASRGNFFFVSRFCAVFARNRCTEARMPKVAY